MGVWPVDSPQEFKIFDRYNKLNNIQLDEFQIKKTTLIPEANIFIILTPDRILVYNFKPVALVACHERSESSIEEFGLNTMMTSSSLAIIDEFNKISSNESSFYKQYHKGKIVVYVGTEKNSLLVYQILSDSTSNSIFKNYGIPVMDIADKCKNYDPNPEAHTNDDVLKVVNSSNRNIIIQNGYLAKKDTGFFPQLKLTIEAQEAVTIRRLELRLMVIFKLDHTVINLVALKKMATKDKSSSDVIALLTAHGLQCLHISNFKIEQSEFININYGFKTHVAGTKLIILSKYIDCKDKELLKDCGENEAIFRISSVDLSKRFATPIKDLIFTKNLLTSFVFDGKLVFSCAERLDFFNIETGKLITSWKPGFRMKFAKNLKNKIILIISEKNIIYFFTEFGNMIFSTNNDNYNNTALDYSNFIYFDKMLVTFSNKNRYQVWHCWEELKQTQFNFRVPQSFLVNNSNNDIAFFSSYFDACFQNKNVQIIKLPTRTVNNCIPIIRLNSTSKLLAAYISNKDLLLLQDIETGIWYSFSEQSLIDMQWLGSNYLLCHGRMRNGKTMLQCLHVPLEGINRRTYNESIIWEQEIPEEARDFKFITNILSDFRTTPTHKKAGNKEKQYVSAELILIYNNYIKVVDIVSKPHPTGLRIIHSFAPGLEINCPVELCARNISWLTSYKNGFLVYSNDEIFKVFKVDEYSDWSVKSVAKNVERILDVVKDKIYLVKKNHCFVYRLKDFWAEHLTGFAISIDDEFYPMSIHDDYVTTHGLHIVNTLSSLKLTVEHKIYLDKVISFDLRENISPETIATKYSALEYYDFALEKILSYSIFQNEPLEGISNLIKVSSEMSEIETKVSKNSKLLKIVSNSLRKIEAKYWDKLFKALDVTPKDLLTMCMETNNIKVLGLLLVVFLNYNESDLVENIRTEFEEKGQLLEFENSEVPTADPLNTLVKDGQLMLEVLRILVTSAAKSNDSQTAMDLWDMCFQLIRFLKLLDKENSTKLTAKAMKICI